MSAITHLVWVAVQAGEDPLHAAPAEEGLFHHAGQPAFYAATNTYSAKKIAEQGAAIGETSRRTLICYEARLDRVEDIGEADFPLSWYSFARDSQPVPSWAISDAARAKGADALIWKRYGIEQIVIFAPRQTCLSDTGLREEATILVPQDDRDLYR